MPRDLPDPKDLRVKSAQPVPRDPSDLPVPQELSDLPDPKGRWEKLGPPVLRGLQEAFCPMQISTHCCRQTIQSPLPQERMWISP